MLDVIVKALWNKGNATADEAIYSEMKNHAIAAIPGNILPELSLSSELKSQWEKTIYQQISYYIRYKYTESRIPLTVPYVILKGTAAAQYYPNPELRTMGDIDLMTSRTDFDDALDELVNDGYKIISDINREVKLLRNGITIELHRYFASLNSPSQAKYLDDLIIDNINSSHYLPDLINGIVLLEHIGQHLENGLGLRQLLDWMMFVDKCLPDTEWKHFKPMCDSIGLTNLAIVSTRACEIYLKLPNRNWCCSADDELCIEFMNYILSCGNFGNKRTDDCSISEYVISRSRNVRSAYKLLQERGLANWYVGKKYRILTPFAWIYQLVRYIKKGLFRNEAGKQIKMEYKIAKKRIKLFDALGVKQASKGLYIYKDGKYVLK